MVSRRGYCEEKAAFASSLNLPQLVDLNLLKGSSGLIKRAFSSALLHRAGGVPVLAHPMYARADEMLPELVKQGLRGLEVYHTKHDAETTKHYKHLAEKYHLLITGGSDSHGREVSVGSVLVPYSFVENLKKEVAKG